MPRATAVMRSRPRSARVFADGEGGGEGRRRRVEDGGEVGVVVVLEVAQVAVGEGGVLQSWSCGRCPRPWRAALPPSASKISSRMLAGTGRGRSRWRRR